MRVLVDAAGVTKPAGNSGWSLAVYGHPIRGDTRHSSKRFARAGVRNEPIWPNAEAKTFADVGLHPHGWLDLIQSCRWVSTSVKPTTTWRA